MVLNLFDDEPRPDIVGPVKHGPLGFNHRATIHDIDYMYQAEEWLEEVKGLDRSVVRAELYGDDGRTLRRWRLEENRWKPVL